VGGRGWRAMILRSTTQMRRDAERGFFLLLSIEPSGPRSSGAVPSFLLSCDPPMTRDARPRTCDPRGARSTTAREAAAVARWRREVRCGCLRERERERVNWI
jgi:hypothetical protein